MRAAGAIDPGRSLALAIVVGLAVGALTQVGQGLLPDAVGQAANAISPWLLAAFLVAAWAAAPRWAVVVGVVTLAMALVGYYGLVQLRFGYGGSTGSLAFWGLASLVGGVVFGLAGWTWRRDDRPRLRALALGLLAGVFVAEGAYVAMLLGRPVAGLGFAVVGLAIPAALGRSREDRLGGYVAILPALALGAAGYLAFSWLSGLTAGIA